MTVFSDWVQRAIEAEETERLEAIGLVMSALLRERMRTNERGSDLDEFPKLDCRECGRRVMTLEDGRCEPCNAR